MIRTSRTSTPRRAPARSRGVGDGGSARPGCRDGCDTPPDSIELREGILPQLARDLVIFSRTRPARFGCVCRVGMRGSRAPTSLFPTGLTNADAALTVTKAAATAFFLSPWFVWNEEESRRKVGGHALMGSVTQAFASGATSTEPTEDCRSLGRADRAATSAELSTTPYRSDRFLCPRYYDRSRSASGCLGRSEPFGDHGSG